MSHAPGLSGMPVSGQRSSAVTSASWARSSARPTSRTMRTRPPRSRADSIRQTASMAARVASSLNGASPGSASGLLLRLRLEVRAQLLLLRARLGGELGAEVLELVEGADLQLRLL